MSFGRIASTHLSPQCGQPRQVHRALAPEVPLSLKSSSQYRGSVWCKRSMGLLSQCRNFAPLWPQSCNLIHSGAIANMQSTPGRIAGLAGIVCKPAICTGFAEDSVAKKRESQSMDLRACPVASMMVLKEKSWTVANALGSVWPFRLASFSRYVADRTAWTCTVSGYINRSSTLIHTFVVRRLGALHPQQTADVSASAPVAIMRLMGLSPALNACENLPC